MASLLKKSKLQFFFGLIDLVITQKFLRKLMFLTPWYAQLYLIDDPKENTSESNESFELNFLD